MFTEKKTLSPHKLFLHIGLHKTGTSSIQEALIKNKKLLKNEKIPDFRTAAYKTAIEKIALSYEFIGL